MVWDVTCVKTVEWVQLPVVSTNITLGFGFFDTISVIVLSKSPFGEQHTQPDPKSKMAE
jgi:hypothetical protein